MTAIITTEITTATAFSTEDIIIPSTFTRKTKTDTAKTVSDIMTVL